MWLGLPALMALSLIRQPINASLAMLVVRRARGMLIPVPVALIRFICWGLFVMLIALKTTMRMKILPSIIVERARHAIIFVWNVLGL